MKTSIIHFSHSTLCTVLFLFFLAAGITSAGKFTVTGRDPDGHGILATRDGKRFLVVEGTPGQMGRAQGLLLREDIRKMAFEPAYLVGLGYSITKGDWYHSRMDEVLRRTKPHTPRRFIEEIDVMADAAGVPERDMRNLNFFPEMFHCSGVAVRGGASLNGQVIHARVLDYMRDINLQKYALVTVFIPEGYHKWISLGYAGFVGTVTAMNEKGLAIGEVGGGGEGDWDGCPMNMLMRLVMEETSTVDEALALMRATPRTCEYYYVLSDKNGDMAAVYCTPDKMDVLLPGVQYDRLPFIPEDTVLISPGERGKHLSRRLQEQYGKIDVKTMIDIIKRPVAMRSNLHNAVFLPETLEMWFADAGKHTPACDEPYARCSLPELIDLFYNDRAARNAANNEKK